MRRKQGFQFNGLGFPVLLVGVKLTSEGVPDINFNHLADAAFGALIRKPSRLSGAELRFIRHQFGMTQDAFAKLLLVERSSVTKWEGKDLAATGMEPATEVLLRMQMARKIKGNLNSEFPSVEPAVRTKIVGKPIELAV